MRRIFAVMCIRNEASRYLESSLLWNRECWDELFVFDDQSDDASRSIAERFGYVVTRSDDEPSFLDHEAKFRATGWKHFESLMRPTVNDWVLALDADEFLITESGKRNLHTFASLASNCRRRSVAFHVPEVWENRWALKVRVDGFWNANWNPRFCGWHPDHHFNDRAMGCGSTPAYAWSNPLQADQSVQILHVGYLDPHERQARFERYQAHPEGHNPTHINSILDKPVLESWSGISPPIWRGER